MAKNLVIVESPAKAKTITKFLGKDYTILASMGHVRDLPTKELGFDPNNNFEPQYEVTKDKKQVISNLKKEIEKDTTIWLASDEDREGEAISWHLVSALKIEKHPLKRIVFHEITKDAILDAMKHPREIDQNLVDAQQARRILDRAVGYELSPLLWKKLKYGLSAGRVQSVAVRLIVDREREIRAFKPEEFWKIRADFKKPEFSAELAKINGKNQKVKNETEAKAIETSAKKGVFEVTNIDEKEGTSRPAAPFTTSTLQQEASRKLGFSVKQTMVVAQQLYEGNVDVPGHTGGLITYMRTDSFNLSEVALKQAQEVIAKEFGKEYGLSAPRKYTTKSKGAQEAHEAIRPVNLALKPSDIKNYLDGQQFKLYDLIWKRTLATQMAEAKIAKTVYSITAGEKKELTFEADGQRIVFPGFMQAYTEGSDDPDAVIEGKDKILPTVKVGQILDLDSLNLEQCFTKPPARYTEASLVKKLEQEGIGRPSTYAPTISTIQTREYVEKTEDKKLKPTDIGELVTDFLIGHFSDIVDYSFTARMEEEFDEIAAGKMKWTTMMQEFYKPFHDRIEEKGETVTRAEVAKMRDIGADPKSGKPVSARVGRFGPFVQIGTKDDEETPRFASIPKGISLEDITLEEALKLFDLPRKLGKDVEGNEVEVNRGRFGPYIKLGKAFFSIKEDDPMTITLERALEVVAAEKERKAKAVIKDFGDIQVLEGRFGPYIKQGKDNFKIPKTQDATELTEEMCKELIAKGPTGGKKRFVKKAATTKTTEKKAPAKKATTKKTPAKKVTKAKK